MKIEESQKIIHVFRNERIGTTRKHYTIISIKIAYQHSIKHP